MIAKISQSHTESGKTISLIINQTLYEKMLSYAEERTGRIPLWLTMDHIEPNEMTQGIHFQVRALATS
jgi:hypothetical protein